MKDIRIDFKLRNNNILKAIEEKGKSTGASLAKEIGISYVVLNDMINMQYKIYDRNGEYKDSVMKLCLYLNKMPDELFSEFQKENVLGTNKTFLEIEQEQIPLLTSYGSSERIKIAINESLNSLTDKEKDVINLYFGLADNNELSLNEIAKRYNCRRSYIRQVKEKALRKLRHPTRREVITDAMHDDNFVMELEGAV